MVTKINLFHQYTEKGVPSNEENISTNVKEFFCLCFLLLIDLWIAVAVLGPCQQEITLAMDKCSVINGLCYSDNDNSGGQEDWWLLDCHLDNRHGG